MYCFHHIRRALHNTPTCLLPRTSRRGNPGIGGMSRVLDDNSGAAEEELQHNDAEGYFTELESDFMDVHRTHRQHEQQQQQQRDNIRRRIVARKYFRELPMPNMLTYGEKEQMRLLHACAPEEWTPERLSESFPASAEVVAKILEAKWRPRSAQRIREHDETVMQRWEHFRDVGSKGGGGAISGSEQMQRLPQALRDHLQKFATRTREDLQTPAEAWPTRSELPKPRGQEFASLISSCSKYAEEKPQNTQVARVKVAPRAAAPPPTASGDPEADTYLLDKVHDKRKMRLQELKQFKLSPAELATAAASVPAATPEQKLLYSGDNPAGTGMVSAGSANPFGGRSSSSAVANYAQKFESSEIVITEEDRKRFEITRIKDRIHIPRRLWRRGGTFRVEDCYYDDDGELLYRVPGMTGER